MSLRNILRLPKSSRALPETGPDDWSSDDSCCRCNECSRAGVVFVPAVIGGTTAVIASAMTAERFVKGKPISVTADTAVQAAPDNFWTLLGKLVSLGGWALLLIVSVPMLVSWLMPGPVQFKQKNR